jgi:uncharacterized protein (TIGR00661 family)
MAKIVYGVCGDGHGHAMRALTVARALPDHDFLFVTWGDALPMIGTAYPVVECVNPGSPVTRHRIDLVRTARLAAGAFIDHGRRLRRVRDAISRFGATAALTDHEYFVPRASRALGIPCLSFDHQHVITAGAHPVPLRYQPAFHAARLTLKVLFMQSKEYLVTSFYRPDRIADARIRIHPPLLRSEALARRPSHEDHVVAYQGLPTFDRFLPFLRTIDRPVVAYGIGRPGVSGNIRFKPYSEATLLDDLAACAYVIAGGGHTLMSEALHFGKPVLSFPVHGMFEQTLNAIYLQRLGYGRFSADLRPAPVLVTEFEQELPRMREAVSRGRFCGNEQILSAVDQFVRNESSGIRMAPSGPALQSRPPAGPPAAPPCG